jgi:hypothetical protein
MPVAADRDEQLKLRFVNGENSPPAPLPPGLLRALARLFVRLAREKVSSKIERGSKGAPQSTGTTVQSSCEPGGPGPGSAAARN